MPVIPQAAGERLLFFRTHLSAWAEHAAAIGVDEESVAELAALVEAAAEARAHANDLEEKAASARLLARNADATMERAGQTIVRTIKAFAESVPLESSNVYALALIPAPARPGPKRRDQSERNAAVPRIRTCTAEPNSHGEVTLTWTCGLGATMGAGTGMSYKIERWFNGQRAGAHVIDVIGSPGPGRRSNVYTDRHVPPGLSTVQYQVTPIQRGGIGNAGPVAMVQFGMVGTTRAKAA